MEKRLIQDLVKQCATGLFDLACAVSGHTTWDLTLPVAVIDARDSTPRLTVTAVGTINSIVKASAVIGTPLMQRFFDRFSSVGLEQARDEFIAGEEAEAFKEMWESYMEERRSGGQAMWSIEDATAFVMHSRASHQDREVACVAILPGDPHAICTFSVPIQFLTSIQTRQDDDQPTP
ncbi:MAG: hypothetical protein ACON4T_07590 [Synechococcus sp.]